MLQPKEWRIGEDLSPHDSLLDGYTFRDLIRQLHYNHPANMITSEVVMLEFESVISQRLQDARFLVQNNMDIIIEHAKDENLGKSQWEMLYESTIR